MSLNIAVSLISGPHRHCNHSSRCPVPFTENLNLNPSIVPYSGHLTYILVSAHQFLNLTQNLALTLTSQPDPISTENHIGTINLLKHQTLTLALTLRTDHTMDIYVTHVSL